MDRFNEFYAYPENPDKATLSDSEISENENYINGLQDLNSQRKRKKQYSIDDWSMIYSDDLWYIWCIISDYTRGGKSVRVLDTMDFGSFCSMCYENSTKY